MLLTRHFDCCKSMVVGGTIDTACPRCPQPGRSVLPRQSAAQSDHPGLHSSGVPCCCVQRDVRVQDGTFTLRHVVMPLMQRCAQWCLFWSARWWLRFMRIQLRVVYRCEPLLSTNSVLLSTPPLLLQLLGLLLLLKAFVPVAGSGCLASKSESRT